MAVKKAVAKKTAVKVVPATAAEMETLRRDIAALQVELTQTKADLADSLKKIEEFTKPKENWFISIFSQDEARFS